MKIKFNQAYKRKEDGYVVVPVKEEKKQIHVIADGKLKRCEFGDLSEWEEIEMPEYVKGVLAFYTRFFSIYLKLKNSFGLSCTECESTILSEDILYDIEHNKLKDLYD